VLIKSKVRASALKTLSTTSLEVLYQQNLKPFSDLIKRLEKLSDIELFVPNQIQK